MPAKEKTTKRIMLKLTEFEKNRIKGLANQYADGNVTLWILHQALYADRSKINPSDIKRSSRRLK